MHGILIESLDPALNLALEQHLFETLPADSPGVFLLWHNAPSIIVGRHQNTVQEVNQELVRRFELPVVRRMTGGGAVYHDQGNLNFSFLQPLEGRGGGGALDFGVFLRPIVKALDTLGVKAEFSSRNDLTVGGRKISGSAQLRRAGKVLHHGTLIVNLDLEMLGAVLTGAPDKYLSKGIASLRSRVVNLCEVLPAGVGLSQVKAALLDNCATDVVPLPQEALEGALALAEARYRNWEWNYGASPAFTECRRQRFPWGAVECCLNVRRGCVESCHIYGDYFSQRDTTELEALLCGLHLKENALNQGLASLSDADWDLFFAGCDPAVMREFFCRC